MMPGRNVGKRGNFEFNGYLRNPGLRGLNLRLMFLLLFKIEMFQPVQKFPVPPLPDITGFEKRWDEAVTALGNSIELLRHPQEFGAISSQYLPYVSILPVFSALHFHRTTSPPGKQLDAQRKIMLAFSHAACLRRLKALGWRITI